MCCDFHDILRGCDKSSFSTLIFNSRFHAIIPRHTHICTHICTYMYILRINNNLGDPPNRLVFICRAYNTWRLTTRDTRRLRERESRRVLASQRLTKMSRSLSSHSPRRIPAGRSKGFRDWRWGICEMKKIASTVVPLATSVGTFRDSTAASYPKFSLAGCVLH